MQPPERFTDEELRAWDWQAALYQDDRSIPWLARQTRRHQNTVYTYSWGKRTPPIEWLRKVARILRKEAAA
jgi:hypothetical protein